MTGVPDPLDQAVQRMLEGDEGAFRIVYRAVHPPLLRYLSILVGQDDAEDVASETWAQGFRDLDRFAGDADGFRGWLTTIGRHRALDHLRRAARRPMSPLAPGDLDELPHAPGPESHVMALLSTDAAVQLIGSLPPDQAEAVMLRAVLGFDAETAGRILGKRAGAVRTASYRGLKALARQLERSGATNPLPSLSDTFVPRGAEGVR
jgi:RNA polymerase sigma-70 factor, ECF subfamily